jgi:hypothetical protein
MKRASVERAGKSSVALVLFQFAGLVTVLPVPSWAADPSAPSPTARTFAQPALQPSAFGRDAPETLSGRPTVPAVKPALAEPRPVAVVDPVPAPAVAPLPAAPAVSATTPAFPRTLGDAALPPAGVEAFTVAEVEAGRSRCAALLKGLDVVVLEEQPIKSGSCGAVAPVQLLSVGRSPQVTLSPPVTMTCDMVAALHKWIAQDVQPLAKRYLGAPVISIETMSSYSCRNAYGRKRGNLSEHGRANALDIRGFQTADARMTSVLDHWGPTGWEIKAQVAAAARAAAAEKLVAEKAAAAKAAQVAAAKALAAPAATSQPGAPTAPVVAQQPPPANTPTLGTIIEGVPGIANRLPGAAPAAEGRTGYGWGKPSQLGGPKVKDKPPVVTSSTAPLQPPIDPAVNTTRSQFLRAVHASACRIFGTTLGPETNLAHKNHLHIDMAHRERNNYCE